MRTLVLTALLVPLIGCATPTPPRVAPVGPLAPLVGAMPTSDVGEDGFSFLLGGHLYGDPGTLSAVPSPTFLAMLQPIRGGTDHFMVSMGDWVRAFEPEMIVPTCEVFTWLDRPVWNAPGNHDYRAGAYEAQFGRSFGAFRVGPALFFVLNTELTPWSVAGEQLDKLREAVAFAADDPGIHHLFVMGHKLIYAADEPRYEALFAHCNGRDGWAGVTNVQSEVVPLLRGLAQTKNVVWCAGDIGVSWGLSLFYDRHPDWGITCVATGLGSTRRDNLLRIHVGPGADWRVEPLSLELAAGLSVGEPVGGDPRAYGVDAWRRHFADVPPR